MPCLWNNRSEATPVVQQVMPSLDQPVINGFTSPPYIWSLLIEGSSVRQPAHFPEQNGQESML